MSANDRLGPVIRKLASLAPLDATDGAAIRSLPNTLLEVRNGHLLLREGDAADTCFLLLSGHTCRHKLTNAGRRQILSFHIAGDILDLQHLLLCRADHNLLTITDATMAVVPSEALRVLARERPRIGEALWRDTLIEASAFREWLRNVGRLDARARIAHLLCEFATKREAAGLGRPDGYDLPMTQEQIADATGLTPVHVNRMLAALEADGLIGRNRGKVGVTDWAGLRVAAGFDPAYLHLPVVPDEATAA